jgi:hypothetical protein
MENEWTSETLEGFKHPARLPAREDFIQSSHHDSLKIYITRMMMMMMMMMMVVVVVIKCDKKEAEKILKYKDLITEIQRMWNVKTKVTPVKIGATGTTSKSFRKYLISIQGKHDIKELQKAAILSTAHVLRKVLI